MRGPRNLIEARRGAAEASGLVSIGFVLPGLGIPGMGGAPGSFGSQGQSGFAFAGRSSFADIGQSRGRMGLTPQRVLGVDDVLGDFAKQAGGKVVPTPSLAPVVTRAVQAPMAQRLGVKAEAIAEFDALVPVLILPRGKDGAWYAFISPEDTEALTERAKATDTPVYVIDVEPGGAGWATRLGVQDSTVGAYSRTPARTAAQEYAARVGYRRRIFTNTWIDGHQGFEIIHRLANAFRRGPGRDRDRVDPALAHRIARKYGVQVQVQWGRGFAPTRSITFWNPRAPVTAPAGMREPPHQGRMDRIAWKLAHVPEPAWPRVRAAAIEYRNQTGPEQGLDNKVMVNSRGAYEVVQRRPRRRLAWRIARKHGVRVDFFRQGPQVHVAFWTPESPLLRVRNPWEYHLHHVDNVPGDYVRHVSGVDDEDEVGLAMFTPWSWYTPQRYAEQPPWTYAPAGGWQRGMSLSPGGPFIGGAGETFASLGKGLVKIGKGIGKGAGAAAKATGRAAKAAAPVVKRGAKSAWKGLGAGAKAVGKGLGAGAKAVGKGARGAGKALGKVKVPAVHLPAGGGGEGGGGRTVIRGDRTIYRGGHVDSPTATPVAPPAAPQSPATVININMPGVPAATTVVPAGTSGVTLADDWSWPPGTRRPNPAWTVHPSQVKRRPFPTYDERPYLSDHLYQPFGRFPPHHQPQGPFNPSDSFGGEPAFPTSREASMYGLVAGPAPGAFGDSAKLAPSFGGAYTDSGGLL